MKKEISYKIVALVFGILVICFAVAFYAIGFTEPKDNPPEGNVSLPLNTSNIPQSKEGGLILNTGGATNGLIVAKGNVGIGTGTTTTPQAKLDIRGDGVAGGIYFKNSGGEIFRNYFVDSSSDADFYMTYSGSGGADIIVQSDGDVVLVRDDTGNVGIGKGNPTEKLEVDGNIYASGQVCDSNGCIGSGGAGVWIYSGDQYYGLTFPSNLTWKELDISGTVGNRRTMVILKAKADKGSRSLNVAPYSERDSFDSSNTNGQNMAKISTDNPDKWGMLMAYTDSDGKLALSTTFASTTTWDVEVLAYMPF